MLKRDVVVLARLTAQRDVLRAWWGHTRYKLHREAQRRAAVRHRYLRTLSAGLGGLVAAVQRRRDKEDLLQQVARHRDQVVLRASFRAWSEQFLPAAAEDRARAARAALMWKRQLLTAALAGWRAEAGRCAAWLWCGCQGSRARVRCQPIGVHGRVRVQTQSVDNSHNPS